MAELFVSTVATKLVEYVVQSSVESTVEAIAPYFGGRDKLNELEKTMKFIQARLHDAERRGEGENEAVVKEWLVRLKAVLFRLEDLFEEVAFADQENEQQLRGGKRGKHKLLPKRLSIFLSRSSPLKVNKLVADEAKAIMEELESIKSDMTSLGFREHYGVEAPRRPLFNRAIDRETGSYVVEEMVIGRDEDKNEILGMLLDSNVDHVGNNKDVCVIPITGIGGLGKTTLAQLVFNDKNVQAHFELKAWACISEVSTFDEFAGKILKSLAGDDYTKLTLEEIQTRLREAVNNKKFFLVLDDVWDEGRDRWLRLKGLLLDGQQGSKIIVTTRSRVVAAIMGTVVEPYELGGLSKNESWDLFKSIAFKKGQEERIPQLTSIGREIVDKCANVPLAIRAIAALLYCKDTEQEWRLFKDKDLLALEQQGEDRVMPTLKLSYDHLEPHLKQCFAYCSLFPKDYVFHKERLINHWMVQGYIKSSDGTQGSLADVGHGYFMELLRRSFFQDVERDEFTETIVRCKMHDLMNDLARKVAGDGCLLVADDKLKIKDDTHVWHVSCESLQEVPSWLFGHAKRIRSFIYFGKAQYGLNENFFSLRYLRTLDLGALLLESLPDSIGEMKHLRYLGINVEELRNFPQSITRLRNLQILELLKTTFFSKEIELPTGFNELINLRSFIVVNPRVINLKDMPPGFGQLTGLQKLTLFIVGENNRIDALAKMEDLAGELEIRYRKHRVEALSEAKAANLKGKKVTGLKLRWLSVYRESTTRQAVEEEEDLVLQWLQPPPTIRWLEVRGWTGRRFPYWGMDKLPHCSLPSLVSVHIVDCRRCKHLPPFSRLPHLRVLVLWGLSVEYIEIGGTNHRSQEYFPSLERLELKDLHELKGWSKEEDEDVDEEQQKYLQTQQRCLLPNLANLKIERCEKLISMPLVVPRLESLFVLEFHGKGLQDLLSVAEQSTKDALATTTTTSPSSSSSMTLSRLRKLSIDSVDELEHLSIDLSSSLEQLTIKYCKDLTTLTAERPSSLRQLHIQDCLGLTDISGAVQHLSNLEVLEIKTEDSAYLTSLATAESWQGLKSLRSLQLDSFKKLQSPRELHLSEYASLRMLPEWIGYLSQLQLLQIGGCDQLSAIPVLPSSLRRFEIAFCNKLVDVSAVLQHLSLLEVLEIRNCDNLDLWEESESAAAAAWQGLKGLRSLKLRNMECLTSLPRGLGCLTMLEELEFFHLYNLRDIPEWIGHLTQLRQLQIHWCSKLTALPSSLGNLTQLRQLEIRSCSKLTTLPSSLRNLTALQLKIDN